MTSIGDYKLNQIFKNRPKTKSNEEITRYKLEDINKI